MPGSRGVSILCSRRQQSLQPDSCLHYHHTSLMQSCTTPACHNGRCIMATNHNGHHWPSLLGCVRCGTAYPSGVMLAYQCKLRATVQTATCTKQNKILSCLARYGRLAVPGGLTLLGPQRVRTPQSAALVALQYLAVHHTVGCKFGHLQRCLNIHTEKGYGPVAIEHDQSVVLHQVRLPGILLTSICLLACNG